MNYDDTSDLGAEFLQYASVIKLTEGQDMTPMELNAAITVIKNGFDWINNLGDIKDQAKSSELTRVISSMNLELAKLETELATREREAIAKDKEIEALKEQLAGVEKPNIANQLTLNGKFWTTKNEPKMPVCRNCTEKQSRFIYLAERNTFGLITHACPECGTIF